MQNICGKEISVLKLLRLKGFIHQLKKKKNEPCNQKCINAKLEWQRFNGLPTALIKELYGFSLLFKQFARNKFYILSK